MQYILLIYTEEVNWEALPREEQLNWMAEYTHFTQAMASAGVLLGANHLKRSAEALTVQLTSVDVLIQNQPFSKEEKQFSSYFVLEVNDVEEAVRWATRCPAARHGIVEVRPLGPTPTPHLH